jgi:hypothetical protein
MKSNLPEVSVDVTRYGILSVSKVVAQGICRLLGMTFVVCSFRCEIELRDWLAYLILKLLLGFAEKNELQHIPSIRLRELTAVHAIQRICLLEAGELFV